MDATNSFSQNYKGSPKKKLVLNDYIEGIKKGDKSILSRAITLVESNNEDHSHLAYEIVEACIPLSGNSVRIGITGVPGVGKSTFIETFGSYLIVEHQKKVAVLAVDPSSKQSHGSILGDKTRMNELSKNENAFIRPSPSSGALGGVTKASRASIVLCEAAGFNTILVETVGVGQSETEVRSMVDFFLLLMLAGAGDELQGIKRGIMELADLIAINKSDGDNVRNARKASLEYKNALHLFPVQPSGWQPQVSLCSSINGEGIPEIEQHIAAYLELTSNNGYFHALRKNQNVDWMNQSIEKTLMNHFNNEPNIKALSSNYRVAVFEGKMSPFSAATHLIEAYLKNNG
jgi:LAO/AO transport system kinase